MNFNQLGSLHVHIDGLSDIEKLTALVKKLEKDGFPGEVHKVLDFIGGPQRLTEPTYEVHTTGFPGREDFPSFSTTLLNSRADLHRILSFLLQEVPKDSGVVVELERVCAHVRPNGTWEELDLQKVPPLDVNEVPLLPQATLPVEIHHMIDVPKREGVKPIELNRLLLNADGVAPIPYGGWFLFEESNALSYSSNSFSGIEGLKERVLHEYHRLTQHESLVKTEDPVIRTLVERVLGVWRV